MKEKMEWISFEIDEREMFEKHLNGMSEQGWNILGMAADHILYRESNEVKKYVIDICENPNKNDPYKIDRDIKKQIEMYEEFGYTFVCHFHNFLVFESNGLDKIIHTDPEVENRLIEESKRKYRMRYMIIPSIVEIIIIALLLLFMKGFLLYILSSTSTLISLVLLIIVNFSSIIVDTLMKKINKEKKPKFRHLYSKVYAITILAIIGIITFQTFKSPVYPFALLIGALVIGNYSTRNANKRIRGEINDGNANVGYCLFVFALTLLINLTKEIKIENNPMILSENITGKVEEVEKGIDNRGIFLDQRHVNLITKDDVYQYEYYDLKDTFLDDFIIRLIKDKYSNIEYLYDIDDVKVFRLEETIDTSYYNISSDIVLDKIGLVHDNDMIVLNHKLKEDKEHLQKVIQELGW